MRALVFLGVVALSLPARIGHAATIYSDLGAGNSYSSSIWIVQGSGIFPGLYEDADPFTPLFSGALTQIDVPLECQGPSCSVTISLDSDSAGLPGGILASWTLSGLPVSGTLETVTASSPVSLSAGTQYWIVLSPPFSSSGAGWFTNDIGVSGMYQNTGSGWAALSGSFTITAGAFDVQGVPEPSSIRLFAGGMGILALLKAARRISHTSRFLN